MLTVQSETLCNVDNLFHQHYNGHPRTERYNWTCVAVKYFLMLAALGDRDITGDKLHVVLQRVMLNWTLSGLPDVSWVQVHEFMLQLEKLARHPVYLLDLELNQMLDQNYVEIQYKVQNLVFNQYQVVRAFDLLLSHALLEPLNAAS
jgi:hypothetical protein